LLVTVGRDCPHIQPSCLARYTWLENAIGADMPEVHRLVPELQRRKVGDTVWFTNPRRFGGKGRMVVARLEPARHMVLVHAHEADQALISRRAPSGVWSFILEPVDHQTCRLVMRTVEGAALGWAYGGKLASVLFWEPAHFVMERKMMLRIKALAERSFAQSQLPIDEAEAEAMAEVC
jgi:hypothetical protein